MLQESQENCSSFNGNDILVKALGTLEYSGRVRDKGKNYTPRQYFHSMEDRALREFMKEHVERQSKFEANILVQISQMVPTTPQSNVSSSNMFQKHIVLPEIVEQPKCRVDDHTLPVLKANKV